MKILNFITPMAFLLLISLTMYCQTYTVLYLDQSPLLEAFAGDDVSVGPGSPVTLGGNPAATGGTGSYSYLWEPSTGLSNATIPNPVLNPTETTLYTLTIIDLAGCTVADQVLVTVTEMIHEQGYKEVQLFPNPSDQVITICFDPNLGITYYTVLDYGGRMLNHQRIMAGNDNIELDISILPKGSYILKLNNDQIEINRPFVRE